MFAQNPSKLPKLLLVSGMFPLARKFDKTSLFCSNSMCSLFSIRSLGATAEAIGNQRQRIRERVHSIWRRNPLSWSLIGEACKSDLRACEPLAGADVLRLDRRSEIKRPLRSWRSYCFLPPGPLCFFRCDGSITLKSVAVNQHT